MIKIDKEKLNRLNLKMGIKIINNKDNKQPCMMNLSKPRRYEVKQELQKQLNSIK